MVILNCLCRHEMSASLTEDNAKHWRGAEPKRRQWRMKRGGSLVSKEGCRTAGKADDYCEPDRASEAQRDGVPVLIFLPIGMEETDSQDTSFMSVESGKRS